MVAKLSKSQLAGFTPLDALNPENLSEIKNKSEVHKVTPGKHIFRTGDVLKQHFYLLEGEVDIVEDGGRIIGTIRSNTDESRAAISHSNPQHISARAKTPATVLAVNRDLLDILLTWDQTGSYQVQDLFPQMKQQAAPKSRSEDESTDWMTHILQTKAFHRIPPANIQAMFMRMEAIHYRAGEVVVRQGDPGDYFYTITQGKCEVTRTSVATSESVSLATLGPGDSFGEEALISDAERNATVTSITDSAMMRLSKDDFISLLNEPLLSWVSFEEAVKKVAAGASWLDVRLPTEYKSGHIIDSINIPLIFLRMKMNTLDENEEYIVYCDTSRRSSAASFLLNEKGFTRIHALEGGLSDIPEQVMVR